MFATKKAQQTTKGERSVKKVILLLVALGLIAGFTMSCSVNPSPFSDEYARDFVEKTKWVKMKGTENTCIGVVATRKTGSASSEGMGMTWIPCDMLPQGKIIPQK